MLGWDIRIYRQQSDGTAPARAGAAPGTRVATWEAGLGGLNWIEHLVGLQQAIDLGGDGYPVEYTAQTASVVAQLLAYRRDALDAALDACRPDEWLLIQAWDQS